VEVTTVAGGKGGGGLGRAEFQVSCMPAVSEYAAGGTKNEMVMEDRPPLGIMTPVVVEV
jgi:hypothetical protein